MANTECVIGNVSLKNPVVTSSGTFGFGREYSKFYDVASLGAITTKGLSLGGKEGNKGRRILEVTGGMMNSIGLENPGVEKFKDQYEKYCGGIETVIIGNLGGNSIDDYVKGAEIMKGTPVDILEVNISCPNVKEGGIAFGIKSGDAYELVKEVREVWDREMIVKLSPNAEDIQKMASVCERAGAQGISLINTIRSLRIDINKRKSFFNNLYAGLSGSVVKPIALEMIHRVNQSVDIPIVGMGGICTWEDAVEFIMAGAECISVGSANFYNPMAALEIKNGIDEFLKKEGIKNLNDIRGII